MHLHIIIRYALYAPCFLLTLSAACPAQALEQATLVFSRQAGTFDDAGENLLREAYKRLGISVKTTVLPGERGLILANHGQTDGELNRIAGLENDYHNLIMVPVPLSNIEAVALVRNVRFKVVGWESLKGRAIGIRLGSKFAEKGTKGMKVSAVPQYPALLKMLELGRVDVVVGARATFLAELQKMREEGGADMVAGLTILEPPIDHIKTYHYLHIKHKALLPEITKALSDVVNEQKKHLLTK